MPPKSTSSTAPAPARPSRPRRRNSTAAKADEEKARLNLKLDLQQAFLGTREAWERLEVTRKSLETAQEAQRIVREQYEQGAADISILLQTQVGVTAMQTRSAAAQYDYLTALSNLKRAKGELGGRQIRIQNSGVAEQSAIKPAIGFILNADS